MKRNKKALSLIYLACGFVGWLLFREIFQSVWVLADLPAPHDWVLSPPDFIAIGGGIAIFVILLKNTRVNTFTNEVINELGKVVWPNRKETVISTGVVSVLVGICAIILFLFDTLWGTLVRIFYQ